MSAAAIMQQARQQSFQLRNDLVVRQIDMNEPQWVLKDPLSGQFFFFDEAEYQILARLRKRRSFESLAQHLSCVLDPISLAEFLWSSVRSGLVVCQGSSSQLSHWRASITPNGKWWHNPLAIRLPGFTPGNGLRGLVGGLRLLNRRLLIVVAAFLAITALAITLTQWELLLTDFHLASNRLGDRESVGGTLFLLAIAIGFAKCVHELAHAVACEYFGGRCREIGILLLLGIPCCYCDVSDTWLVREKWKRIIVSAAGIVGELFIGVLALLVWFATRDGSLHDLSILLVVVCSISTIIFNGNPLLRYDGYFIASDLSGITNLYQRGQQAATAWLYSNRDQDDRIGLVIYGLMCRAYRWLVICVIAWIIFQWLSEVDLGWIGGLAAAFIAVAWIRRQFTRLSIKQQHTRSGRLPYDWLTAFACLLVFIFIPLPCSVTGLGQLRPAEGTLVRTSVAGIWHPVKSVGEHVSAGEVIGNITNHRLVSETLKAEGKLSEAQAMLQATRLQRIKNPEFATSIAHLEEQVANNQELLAGLRKECARTAIRAPHAGHLFAAEPRQHAPWEILAQQCRWSGQPTDSINAGASLDVGTPIGEVGNKHRRTAQITLSQFDVGLVRIGQLTKCRTPSGILLAGTVTGISSMTEMPSDDQRPPMVNVDITIEASTNHPELPAGLSITGKVQTNPASLASRARRLFAIHFGL